MAKRPQKMHIRDLIRNDRAPKLRRILPKPPLLPTYSPKRPPPSAQKLNPKPTPPRNPNTINITKANNLPYVTMGTSESGVLKISMPYTFNNENDVELDIPITVLQKVNDKFGTCSNFNAISATATPAANAASSLEMEQRDFSNCALFTNSVTDATTPTSTSPSQVSLENVNEQEDLHGSLDNLITINVSDSSLDEFDTMTNTSLTSPTIASSVTVTPYSTTPTDTQPVSSLPVALLPYELSQQVNQVRETVHPVLSAYFQPEPSPAHQIQQHTIIASKKISLDELQSVPVEPAKYMCKVCQQTFTTRRSLMRHKNRFNHSDEKAIVL